MCVDTKGYDWERPAIKADAVVLSGFFPGVDFGGLLDAMAQDGAKPLTVDLALVGAMMQTEEDAGGMRYVPFSAIAEDTRTIVKLPVMDQIVDWLENSALGTDMWQQASGWCEAQYGRRVQFAMNCGCGLVAVESYQNGRWAGWKQKFNAARADLFGRTKVTRRDADSIEGLDMTAAQLAMWQRLRQALEALPAVARAEEDQRRAA